MKTVIISGGTIQDGFALDFLKKTGAECILAADRGLEFCYRNQIRPDYILGDFDSIDPGIIAYYRNQTQIPIDTFNPVKDSTDTDIATKKSIELGASEILFLGATGTRLDHTLSNIYNLSLLRQQGLQGTIVDAHNLITMPLGRSFVLRKDKQFGKYVSCFPFRKEVKGLTLEGFQYPLQDYTLELGDGGLSVSNEIVEEEARIEWREGILVVMQTRD